MLTKEQTNILAGYIDKSRITLPGLCDDLLDHFCCFVEEEMEKGTPFDAAFAKAKHQICPNGPQEIEMEAVYLLTPQKIKIMKKIVYAIGLISAMTLSLGFLFKMQRYPGTIELLNTGLYGLVFVFLPLLAALKYRRIYNTVISEKLKLIAGYSSALLFATGVVLRMQDLAAAGMYVQLTGFALFTFAFLPALFFSMYKKSLEKL